ncbi:MAG TPA: hypothetical protein VGG10_05955 [Rhizomicrobium sp.]|jgi:hypothetical protein
MLDTKGLLTATAIGTVLQLAMIVAGHISPWVALNVFMLGGMTISALAGLVYARLTASNFASAALGGAIAGAVCAVIGIAASVALGDTAAMILVMGTISSAVTGAIGGLLGRAIPHTASA